MNNNPRRMVLAAGLTALVALGAGAAYWRSAPEHVDVVGQPDRANAPAQPVANSVSTSQVVDGSVPGKGVVDVPLGEMVKVAAPNLQAAGLEQEKPVKVAGPGDKYGYVAWTDFAVDVMPADPTTPYPMVPVVDEAGRQVAWWAKAMGWVSFDTVAAPGFDYRQAYSAFVRKNSPSCANVAERDESIPC